MVDRSTSEVRSLRHLRGLRAHSHTTEGSSRARETGVSKEVRSLFASVHLGSRAHRDLRCYRGCGLAFCGCLHDEAEVSIESAKTITDMLSSV